MGLVARISVLMIVVCGCDGVFGLDRVRKVEASCTLDQECVRGVIQGRCDCGFCSYPDQDCATTNRRWHAAAEGELGDACVAVPDQIDARVYHTCVVMSDGTAWCWGWNLDAQLGAGQELDVDSTIPIRVTASDGTPVGELTEIGTGALSTCAMRGDSVVCWGGNAGGQLGAGLPIGDGMRSVDPVEVSTGTSALTGVTALTVGFRHACARVGSTQLFCWGDNARGQVGDGTTTIRNVAVPVQGLPAGEIRFIGAGGEHSCAVIRESSTLTSTWCWGRQFDGRLGNGTEAEGAVPIPQHVQLTGGGFLPDVQGLAVGAKHTCAIRHTPFVGPELYCWGFNAEGAIGDGTRMWRVRATKVMAPAGETAHLASDDLHTCGDIGPDLWCWGSDEVGQIGDGPDDSTSKLLPVRVIMNAAVRELTAGFRYTCSLGNDRRIQCWGANDRGQLGIASTANQHVPTEISATAFCPMP
ncbi:MAG TPA: hypothetical protein VIV11_04710 [Kofleriaceae bacterium]